jgi:hypothetical protein
VGQDQTATQSAVDLVEAQPPVEADPETLGIAPPPPPPVPPAPPQIDQNQRRMRALVALAAGLAGGPNAVQGIGRGLQDIHQQENKDIALQVGLQNQQYGRQVQEHAIATRMWEQDAARRQQLLQQTVKNIQEQVARGQYKTLEDFMSGTAVQAQMLQAQGLRITPNQLRAWSHYLPPDDYPAIAKSLIAFENQNKDNGGAVGMLKQNPNATLGYRSVMGVTQSIPLAKAIAQVGHEIGLSFDAATGQAIPNPQQMPLNAAQTHEERVKSHLDDLVAALPSPPTDPADLRKLRVKADDMAKTDEAKAKAEEKRLEEEAVRSLGPKPSSTDAELQGLRKDLLRGQIAAVQEKQTTAQTQQQAQRQAVVDSAKQSLSAVNELIDKDGHLQPGVAPLFGRMSVLTGVTTLASSEIANKQAALEQLTARRITDLIQEMKAQSRTGATGFGQLNRSELALLERGATQLTNRRMAPERAAALLVELRQRLDRILAPGAGDVAANAPAPADVTSPDARASFRQKMGLPPE